MSGVSAWVMQLDHVLSAAVGQMELIHIVDNPELIYIPKAPSYCNHVVLWNSIVIPVLDLSAWLNDSTLVYRRNLVAIAVYRDEKGVLKYGGLHLADTPTLVTVSNDDACNLPVSSSLWQKISISCFSNDEHAPVPIIDIPKIFSDTLISVR